MAIIGEFTLKHSILSHGAQLSYMLGAADMISIRLPDRSLRVHSSYSFIHSSVQSLFCQEM